MVVVRSGDVKVVSSVTLTLARLCDIHFLVHLQNHLGSRKFFILVISVLWWTVSYADCISNDVSKTWCPNEWWCRTKSTSLVRSISHDIFSWNPKLLRGTEGSISF